MAPPTLVLQFQCRRQFIRASVVTTGHWRAHSWSCHLRSWELIHSMGFKLARRLNLPCVERPHIFPNLLGGCIDFEDQQYCPVQCTTIFTPPKVISSLIFHSFLQCQEMVKLQGKCNRGKESGPLSFRQRVTKNISIEKTGTNSVIVYLSWPCGLEVKTSTSAAGKKVTTKAPTLAERYG